MRALLTPSLLGLAIALAPAAQACHVGLSAGFNLGTFVGSAGPTVGALGLELGDLCQGPTTVTLYDLSPLGMTERVPATLDVLAPNANCIGLSCGGSDPFAAALRFIAPEAGLDLVGVFEYPHATAGWVFFGTVHGLPAAFAASAA